MKFAVVAIFLFFPAVGAHALSCGGGTSDSLYGLYGLFRSSSHIVLATPEQIESSDPDLRRFVLKVSRAWMGDPNTRLTVTENPLDYAFGIPKVSEVEQVFFLVHGNDELAHPACASRAFRAKKETLERLDRIRKEYAVAGYFDKKPAGGIVCIRPHQWQNSDRYLYPRISLLIDSAEPHFVSRMIPTHVANLEEGKTYSLYLREDDQQVSQFELKILPDELEWCLSESQGNWTLEATDCGCTWRAA